jgi:hypothetical protein
MTSPLNVTVLNTCYEKAAARLPPGEDAPTNLIGLGIAIGLAASIVINLAQNAEGRLKPVYEGTGASKKLVRGNPGQHGIAILFIAIAAISNFGAFALAPASVLAPLEGSQFVANLGFHWYVGTKQLRTNLVRILIGTGLVVAGVVLPVLAASDVVPQFDLEAMLCMTRREQWLWTLTGARIAAVASVGAYVYLVQRPKEKRVFDEDGLSISTAEIFFYSIGSALVGGYAVANAKIISELLEMVFANSQWELWGDWYFWTTVTNVTIFFVLWVALLGSGPRYHPAISIIPALQGLYIVFSSIGGGLFFEEFYYFDTRDSLLYFGGMGLICIGLVLMVPVRMPKSDLNAESLLALEADVDNPEASLQAQASVRGVVVSPTVSARVGAGGVPIILYSDEPANRGYHSVPQSATASGLVGVSVQKLPLIQLKVPSTNGPASGMERK